MAKRTNAIAVKRGKFLLNGLSLTISAARAEYTRLLRRFTELAVDQRNAAAETLDEFAEDVESFCNNGDEWAHKYIDAVADLAVEELVGKGCLDIDHDTFVDKYLNTYFWDKRIKSLRDLAQELQEEEAEREKRRHERTESAKHLFDGDYDDEKIMNFASGGVSGIFNAIGRSIASNDMAEKIKAKFDEDHDDYLQAIYLTIKTSVDELITCLLEEKKIQDGGGVSVEEREKADRLFNNLSKSKVSQDVANRMKLEILQLDPYKKEFYDWCFMDDGDPSGELEQIATYFGISLDEAKSKKFIDELGGCAYETEDQAVKYRDKARTLAKLLRYEPTEKMKEIDKKLAEFDRLARTVEDREFKTREEAAKQRELVAFEQTLNLSTEEFALVAQKALKKKIKELKIDGAWKTERVENALRHFDDMARTVDDRMFDTREEAAKQRMLSEFEATQDLSSEEAALKAKENILVKISELKIDGAWKLERVDDALKKFDELARTTFGMIFETRKDAEIARGSRKEFIRGIIALVERSGESSFYYEGCIPAKKLANARKAFPIPTTERVLCLTDTTFFGSGKTGLAITEKGLRWTKDKSVATGKTFLTWGSFGGAREAPKRIGGDQMIFGDNAVYVNGGSNVDDEKMCECLRDMYEYCRAATFALDGSIDSRGEVQRKGGTKNIVEHADVNNLQSCNDQSRQKVDNVSDLSQDVLACSSFVEFVENVTEPLKSCSVVYVGENIPTKKRINAHRSMEVKEATDEIEMLIDATVFGSAKDGLVITRRAIYYKNSFECPVAVPWTKLKTIMVTDKGDLEINSKTFQVIGMEDSESACLPKILNQICEWTRIHNG